MDNIKTGNLIREQRKALGLTQKVLAERLHITDRAVSKWERGLCAPDIALLEPLSEVLGLHVAELISGERSQSKQQAADETVKGVLSYSQNEIQQKTKAAKKRVLLAGGACVAALLLLCTALLWWKGYFQIIGRSTSPDGNYALTVYGFDALARFSREPAITVKATGAEKYTVIYGNCAFENIWWAPDSAKYVISLDTEEGTRLILESLAESHETNLSAILSFGVEATELRTYGYANKDGWPDIEYQFLQWGLDSASMLIYYAFDDQNAKTHEGYFWYNCETGTVSAILELPQ